MRKVKRFNNTEVLVVRDYGEEEIGEEVEIYDGIMVSSCYGCHNDDWVYLLSVEEKQGQVEVRVLVKGKKLLFTLDRDSSFLVEEGGVHFHLHHCD